MHNMIDATGGMDFTPPVGMLGFNRMAVWFGLCLGILIMRLAVKPMRREDPLRVFIEGGTQRFLGAFSTPVDEPSAPPHPAPAAP